MLQPHRLLEQVKRRRRASTPQRLALRAALGLWKAARRVPLVNRARITLRAGKHRMRVRLFSYDDLLTACHNYEPCLRRLPIEPGAVVVDAGAFIGRHTLEFARAVGPAGRVIAVEPLAQNFHLLAHNVRLGGYGNVDCIECALGATDGDVTLSYDRETSIASIAGAGRYHQTVRQRSIDSLSYERGIERIDVLKVDVEGAELAVLAGAETILAASPAARLAIEVHGKPDTNRSTASALRGWLDRRGYVVQAIEENGRRFLFAHQQARSHRAHRAEGFIPSVQSRAI